MAVYLGAAALTMLLGAIFNKKRLVLGNKKKENAFIASIFLFLPLIIITLFRKDTGTDYTTYTVLYYLENINAAGRRGIEIISMCIFNLAQQFRYPRFSILVYGCICCLGYGYFLYKNGKRYKLNLVACVFFFFFSGTFNWGLSAMRQMSAVALCLIAIDFIIKKDPIKYFFVVAIACLIHKTSFLMVAMYFLPYKWMTQNLKKMVIVGIGLLTGSSVLRLIIIWLCNKFHFYNLYFGHADYDQQTYSYSLILLTVVSILLVLYTHKYWKDDREASIWFGYLYIATAFSLISNIIPNSSRIVYMFLPTTTISMPFFLRYLSVNNRRLAAFMLGILYIAFFMKFLYLDNQCGTFPYTWI